MAVATAGTGVWVYSDDGLDTLSRIDVATNRITKRVTTRVHPVDLGVFSGPVLAADAAGAWLVGLDRKRTPRLVRVFANGKRRWTYSLDHEPRGVAVGLGAVWVAARGTRDNQVLRIDPATGRVTARTRFPTSSPIDSVGTGYGAVWAVGSADGSVYRIDPRTARRTDVVRVGRPAGRPSMLFGEVWVGSANEGGKTSWIHEYPGILLVRHVDDCCPPDWGENRFRDGWVWWYDWPTASVYRQHRITEPARQIRVLGSTPLSSGPCLTSIAVGAAIWVTATTSFHLTCTR
jgi:hypothetical protein